MDQATRRRFSFLRQSSLAPGGSRSSGLSKEESQKLLTAEDLDATLQLLFYSSEGKLDAVKQMLARHIDVDATDFDQRTALHVSSCENKIEVVKLLLAKGASVNAEDRWGSTPLADAQHYGNVEICNVLEQHGGKIAKNTRNSLMRISSSLMPEYEIDHTTLDFGSVHPNRKGHLYRVGTWQGTKVWVKFLPGMNVAANDKLVSKFKEELALLLKLRHPNVVQFLGAVTQTTPMMIVTEFLPGGNLKTYMEEKSKCIDTAKAISMALDISRGLNYLHEYKPEPVVHYDLKPSNLLLGESPGHIKVANFGLSQTIEGQNQEEGCVSIKTRGSFARYMAPEIFTHKSYNKSIDIFAFGMILLEMIEGHPPFPELKDHEAAEAYAKGRRPSFRHGGRHYPPVIKEIIEKCWDNDPSKRPLFRIIIEKLQEIQGGRDWRSKLKLLLTRHRPE